MMMARTKDARQASRWRLSREIVVECKIVVFLTNKEPKNETRPGPNAGNSRVKAAERRDVAREQFFWVPNHHSLTLVSLRHSKQPTRPERDIPGSSFTADLLSSSSSVPCFSFWPTSPSSGAVRATTETQIRGAVYLNHTHTSWRSETDCIIPFISITLRRQPRHRRQLT